jgi:hypothetical protein
VSDDRQKRREVITWAFGATSRIVMSSIVRRRSGLIALCDISPRRDNR